MWIKVLFLLLVFFPLSGLAATGVSEIKLDESLPSMPMKKWDAHLTFDAMTRESRQQRQENSHTSLIREFSLGVNYQLNPQTGFFVEGAAQEFDQESEFFISQAYVHFDLSEKYFLAQAGQLYYPVGWLTEEDTYFLNQPLYYQELYPGKKGLDLGVRAQILPFKSSLFILEASCFEGRVFRGSDERSGSAEKRPCALGARIRLQGFEAYLTHFEHDLAFYDPVTANGVGLRASSPIYWDTLSLGLWGEFFQIKTSQKDGPMSVTTAGFVYPYLDFWRLRFGYRFAPSRTQLSYETGNVESKMTDDLFRAEWKILDPVKLIYEDQQVKQNQGVELKNEWALRLLLETAL